MKKRDWVILGFLITALLALRITSLAFFFALVCASLTYVYMVD